MKIGFFVPRCEPDNSHGRYVIALAEAMAAAAYDVTVCAGAITPALGHEVRRLSVTVPNRPSVVRLAMGWVAAAVTMRRQAFDVVHVQGADAGDVDRHRLNQPPHEFSVLDVDGTVEPEVMDRPGPLHLARALSGDLRGKVVRDEEEDHVRHECDDEEQYGRPEYSPDQVPKHPTATLEPSLYEARRRPSMDRRLAVEPS